MGTQNLQNHSRTKKKIKNETPESKFRLELDLCSKEKNLSGAISLYNSAISQNIRLNQLHFNSLLYLCSSAVTDSESSESLNSPKGLALEHGFRIYDHMLSTDIIPNEASITAMARLAAAKGDGHFAFDLVKSMEKCNTLPRLRTYDPVLFYFCENLEAEMAYKVEEHMSIMGVKPEEVELSALLRVSVMVGREAKVYEYLHKLRNSLRCISESTAVVIEGWFSGAVAEELKGCNLDADIIKEAIFRNGSGWHGLGWLGEGKWSVKRSNVNVVGRCCGCGEQLVCIDIGYEETEKFAQSLASLAMEREVKNDFGEFQAWLDKHANFEAVVDGANVGLYQQNFLEGRFSISQLDTVVKEICNKNQKKWPLVILHNKRRRAITDNYSDHNLLEKWMSQNLLYETPNGSNDDWYWLYAAVKLRCLLVTNDEMRDHIFELLGRSFFLKWQERHQVRYTFVKGNLELKMPPPYSLVIQESEKGCWHVPIGDESCDDESSRVWLCITRMSSRFCEDVPAITGKRKQRSPSPNMHC